MVKNSIEFNLSDLLIVFDKLSPLTDESIKYYFLEFNTNRAKVTLDFSVYERKAGIIIECHQQSAATSIGMSNCVSIRVLDEKKAVVEVICGEELETNLRCVLILNDNPSLDISYPRMDIPYP